MAILTVDPGLQGTGVALWRPNAERPITDVINALSHSSWEIRASEICDQVLRYMQADVTDVYVEFPKMMHTAVGIAANEKGDIHRLAAFVGMIGLYAMNLKKTFHPVDVNDWKGNMSKDMVKRRIERALKVPLNFYSSHDADAVGIGLWVQGRLNLAGTTRRKP